MNVPQFIYGTAWKEEETERLTLEALQAGFTAIDTANQRKHYYEAAVGKGIQKFLATGEHGRVDLFLQTKFTFARGQDHRKPYDETADYPTQVRQSFASSLEHLHTDYLDSYVLHGPYTGRGLTTEDWEVWRTMEELLGRGDVKMLGISNVALDQLIELCNQAEIKPQFVQNRCFAQSRWDKQVREYCRTQGIYYQGFSLLTANVREISQPMVQNIARKHHKTIAQVIFRFANQVGMIPLTGTTNKEHMRQDLDIWDFELSPDDIAIIENCAR